MNISERLQARTAWQGHFVRRQPPIRRHYRENPTRALYSPRAKPIILHAAPKINRKLKEILVKEKSESKRKKEIQKEKQKNKNSS